MVFGRAVRRLAAALAASLALAACGGGTAQPATSSPATKLVVLESQVTPGELPIWMAKEIGAYAKHGLDVDLQAVGNGSTTMAALTAGEAQMAGVGGSETLNAVAGGADLRILATFAHYQEYRLLVDPKIQSPADLKGKALATGSRGGSPDIALHVVLNKLGLVPNKDVALISIASQQARLAATLSGTVQGSLFSPPESLKLDAQGYHMLYDMAAQKVPSSSGCLVVPASYIAAHRQTVQAFVDAIADTMLAMRQDRDRTVQLLGKFMGSQDKQAMEATYDFFVGEVMAGSIAPVPDQFTDTVAVLSTENSKLANFDVSRILDRSFIDASKKRQS